MASDLIIDDDALVNLCRKHVRTAVENAELRRRLNAMLAECDRQERSHRQGRGDPSLDQEAFGAIEDINRIRAAGQPKGDLAEQEQTLRKVDDENASLRDRLEAVRAACAEHPLFHSETISSSDLEFRRVIHAKAGGK